MSGITPNPNKRSYLLPPGCKDLIDVLKGADQEPSQGSSERVRVNGKIRANKVRVIGEQGRQLGIMKLSDALDLAKKLGIDLVEIAPHAKPPVCQLVDYGMFRYERSKRRKRKK